MKKEVLTIMAVIFCMFLASCGSALRTYTPYALSTVSSLSLPAIQHSLERKDYEILGNVEGKAVVEAAYSGGVIIKADEFTNVCNPTENGIVYNVEKSKGTVRAGFIDGLNLKDLNMCDGSSLASYLAAYRLINEVKTAGADGVVAPSLYVTAEETNSGIFSRTVTYKVVIKAKLMKLKSNE